MFDDNGKTSLESRQSWVNRQPRPPKGVDMSSERQTGWGREAGRERGVWLATRSAQTRQSKVKHTLNRLYFPLPRLFQPPDRLLDSP